MSAVALTEPFAWDVLESVPDPELPTLSILDLGIVRAVRVAVGQAHITLTPTYSGCPAIDAITSDVETALKAAGFAPQVSIQIAPAWTTDWMRPQARAKLKALGIAAPMHVRSATQANTRVVGLHLAQDRGITCPRCESARVEQLSHFGSTACKALYRCLACREPFDYFKPI